MNSSKGREEVFEEKSSLIGSCIYYVQMTQQPQVEEFEVDQAMSHLLAELDQQ